MTKKVKYLFICAILALMLFCALVCAVLLIDVQEIGPEQSSVGLASVNQSVKNIFEFNDTVYSITEFLGVISLATVLGFAMLGAIQLLRRKNFRKVDPDIYLLGGLYAVVAFIYILFEICIINYRPILIGNELEASFPSSHTILSLCVMISAAHQLYTRLSSKLWRTTLPCICILIAAATVIGRLVCGVHWFTDIIGGVLLSTSLLLAYFGIFEFIKKPNACICS